MLLLPDDQGGPYVSESLPAVCVITRRPVEVTVVEGPLGTSVAFLLGAVSFRA